MEKKDAAHGGARGEHSNMNEQRFREANAHTARRSLDQLFNAVAGHECPTNISRLFWMLFLDLSPLRTGATLVIFFADREKLFPHLNWNSGVFTAFLHVASSTEAEPELIRARHGCSAINTKPLIFLWASSGDFEILHVELYDFIFSFLALSRIFHEFVDLRTSGFVLKEIAIFFAFYRRVSTFLMG